MAKSVDGEERNSPEWAVILGDFGAWSDSWGINTFSLDIVLTTLGPSSHLNVSYFSFECIYQKCIVFVVKAKKELFASPVMVLALIDRESSIFYSSPLILADYYKRCEKTFQI